MGQFENYEKLAQSDKSTTEIVGRYKEQENSEKYIFLDLVKKLSNLQKGNISICDIGCGCGILVKELIKFSEERNDHLTLIDSKSMLDRICEKSHVEKIEGKFPENISKINNKYDVIVVYSVLQYVFLDDNVFQFIDSCVELLNEGGELIIGDIPNLSKKKRFLKTDFGLKIHNKTSSIPIKELIENDFNKMSLDDSFLLMILSRYRSMGLETYILSQDEKLPFSFTREDIIIKKSIS